VAQAAVYLLTQMGKAGAPGLLVALDSKIVDKKVAAMDALAAIKHYRAATRLGDFLLTGDGQALETLRNASIRNLKSMGIYVIPYMIPLLLHRLAPVRGVRDARDHRRADRHEQPEGLAPVVEREQAEGRGAGVGERRSNDPQNGFHRRGAEFAEFAENSPNRGLGIGPSPLPLTPTVVAARTRPARPSCVAPLARRSAELEDRADPGSARRFGAVQESVSKPPRAVRPSHVRGHNPKERAMKYLCLAYGDQKKMEALTKAEFEALVASACRWTRTAQDGAARVVRESGVGATTIRTRGGKMQVTDGPFVETKETSRAHRHRGARSERGDPHCLAAPARGMGEEGAGRSRSSIADGCHQ